VSTTWFTEATGGTVSYNTGSWYAWVAMLLDIGNDGKIRTRLDNEKARLDSISNRIDVANAKTAELEKRKFSSTVVASPFIFPVEEVSHYQPIHLPSVESFPKSRAPTRYKIGPSMNHELPFPEEPFVVLSQKRPTKTNTKSVEILREISSVDNCVVLEKEIQKEKRQKVSKKETEIQKLKDLAPFVWENISSGVIRNGRGYRPLFNNNIPKPNLPGHLSIPNVAENIKITVFLLLLNL